MTAVRGHGGRPAPAGHTRGRARGKEWATKIGVRTHDGAEDRLRYAQQIGAQGGSIWLSALPGYEEKGYADVEPMARLRERFEAHGLELNVAGLGARVIKNQLLGRPERDREIENVCRTIRNMGEAGIPVLIVDQRITYWAQGAGYRPEQTGSAWLPLGRGGVKLHSFDASRITEPDAPAGEVSPGEAWERTLYLYERIVPVAEQAKVKLATHPDDPPMPYYRGVRQILNRFEGFRHLTETFDSPYNGLLLCLGTMQEAGEDVLEGIRHFGRRKRIFCVHYRNVRGKVPKYEEVFQDEGDLDMVAAMRRLKEVGFADWVVNDHNPGLMDDTPWGHRSLARQVGYIRGVLQAIGA